MKQKQQDKDENDDLPPAFKVNLNFQEITKEDSVRFMASSNLIPVSHYTGNPAILPREVGFHTGIGRRLVISNSSEENVFSYKREGTEDRNIAGIYNLNLKSKFYLKEDETMKKLKEQKMKDGIPVDPKYKQEYEAKFIDKKKLNPGHEPWPESDRARMQLGINQLVVKTLTLEQELSNIKTGLHEIDKEIQMNIDQAAIEVKAAKMKLAGMLYDQKEEITIKRNKNSVIEKEMELAHNKKNIIAFEIQLAGGRPNCPCCAN